MMSLKKRQPKDFSKQPDSKLEDEKNLEKEKK